MASVLIARAAIDSGLRILLFRWLRATGHIDVVIAFAYVLFLGVIGALMFAESARALFRTRKSSPTTRRRSCTSTTGCTACP